MSVRYELIFALEARTKADAEAFIQAVRDDAFGRWKMIETNIRTLVAAQRKMPAAPKPKRVKK